MCGRGETRYPTMYFNSPVCSCRAHKRLNPTGVRGSTAEMSAVSAGGCGVPLKNTTCTTFNKEQQSNCSDASIASLHAAKAMNKVAVEAHKFLQSLFFPSISCHTFFQNEPKGAELSLFMYLFTVRRRLLPFQGQSNS